MTYLAPRQGLFAIIILISFSLQTLLLVLSTEQQLEKTQEQKAKQMVTQLINEASLALQSRDRVSLSVIAGRYTSEQDVARLVIKDADNEELVPLGNAPLHKGKTERQIVKKGDAVIGSVALTMRDISKGEIITGLWPFVIGSMLLHLFLWLLYGYVARPTKEQINALGRDIHEHYRQQYKTNNGNSRQVRGDDSLEVADTELENELDAEHSGSSKVTKSWPLFGNRDTVAASSEHPDAQDNEAPASVHDEVNNYVQSQREANSALNDSHPSTDATIDNDTDMTTNATTAETAAGTEKSGIIEKSASAVSPNRYVSAVDVQIVYDDNYRLLDKLAPETADPYFTLCSQLLNQAITELLKQPLLHGIYLDNEPKFDHSGAVVVLKAENNHSKAALAGVMLGKLYLMLNQIIYDKHRELSRFALPIRIGVSDDAQARPLSHLLESVGRRGEMLILYPKTGLREIGNHIQVRNLQRPTTVYERESAFFDGTNEAMMQRLIDVRNAVLLSGNEDA